MAIIPVFINVRGNPVVFDSQLNYIECIVDAISGEPLIPLPLEEVKWLSDNSALSSILKIFYDEIKEV